MSLKQKTVPETPPPFPAGGGRRYDAPSGKGTRRAGLVFVAVGTLAMALAVVLAITSAATFAAGDDPRGSENGERLSGFAGDDPLFGGGGDDEIHGGPGRDLLLGGDGDDFIEAKDGARDVVDCGPGDDVASVDGGEDGGPAPDRVAPNCETVYPG